MQDSSRLLAVFAPNSTRAGKYFAKIRPKLVEFARQDKVIFHEIAIDQLPYFEARELISQQISDRDLVVAAGGDGLSQVTFDAIFTSDKSAVFATLPLGNSNDLARAFNGGKTNLQSILRQTPRDFHPLEISVNGELVFALASYLTFGATTVLVDSLNNEEARARRRKLKALPPAVALPLSKLNQISRQISQLDFPDFQRDGQIFTDDSLGFFLVNGAHNLLRLPQKLALDEAQFFFHHAKTHNKNLLQKIALAGAWTTHFPGKVSDSEKLVFTHLTDITANIAGDNVLLKNVRDISAERSRRTIKILVKK